VVSSEDLVSPDLSLTASFSPGPVTVNYILVGTPRDLTISITVPLDTAPGPQTLDITDGLLTHSVGEALRIVDGTILNPSPSVLSLGGSSILSIAPHPLFSGQSSFSLDLGSDVSVGPITLQPDGSLQAPVSVLTSAIPGTRSVHLTAGPYAFLAERGFGIDFGPLVNTVRVNIGTSLVPYMDLQLPNGYTAGVFALPTAENGLAAPDGMYVDETNTLYVLNHGAIVGPAPFSISVFDLDPSNFGALKGVFRNIDASGRGGLLESATMLPSRPGQLFFSTENYPTGGFGGGQTITELDLATGASRLFWYSPYWNLDPIDTDVTGNMALGHTNSLTGQNEVSRLDPDGNFLDGCTIDVMTDTVRLDPLTGKFLINRPSPGGTQMLDLPTCARVLRSDSPAGGDDEGWFAPGAGDFGNQYFAPIPSWYAGVATLMPVSYTDPDQSVPERIVKFVSGVWVTDGTDFDRDGKNLVVADRYASTLIAIHRIPGYAPPAPAVTLSSTNLTFGDQEVGTTSAAQGVTLSNTGNAALTIAGIIASGGFTQSNDCGNEVAAGDTCAISIAFVSTARGTRTGTVAMIDSASDRPHVIELTGHGTSGIVSLATTSISFADQFVGTTSAEQTVTLSNPATSPLFLDSLGVTGDFTKTSTCGSPVAADGSCTISVTFSPSAIGISVGAVTIADSAPGSPHLIDLSGKGVSGIVSLSTTDLSFGDQRVGTTSMEQTVTLSNPAATPLFLEGVAASGDFAMTHSCGSSVVAGGSCTIVVTFTPSAVGPRAGTVTITSSASGSPHAIALSGNGTAPALTLSSTRLDFGNQLVGATSVAQAVTVTNSGTAPLLISGIVASGDFAQTNTCGNSVAVGANCIINVTFTPSAGGTRDGALTISDDAPDSPQVVILAGVGQDFSIGTFNTERTISAGASTTFSLKLAPEGGFAQSVVLTCAGAPPAASCFVSPSSTVLDGASSVQATATVTTTARSAGIPPADGFPDPPSPKVWGHHPALQQLLWLLALTMLGSLVVFRRRRGLGLSLALTVLLVLLWTACGGGGNSRLPSGTPAGTYTLTVTATTSGGPSHLVKVTLIVN
jgi:hypothetical protein